MRKDPHGLRDNFISASINDQGEIHGDRHKKSKRYTPINLFLMFYFIKVTFLYLSTKPSVL